MTSKALATMSLLLSLNLLFFTLVTSHYVPCPPPPKSSKSPSSPKSPKSPPSPKSPKSPPSSKSPPATPPPSKKDTCSIDTLKLGACANVLSLVNIVVGTPAKSPCCSLLNGLADLDAAVCLCTAIKADVLGINLNIPISLSLVLNYCGKKVPSGYQCA